MTGAWTTLVDGGDFYEAPRWRDGRWWVSDFYNRHVLTVTTDGTAEVRFEVEGQPSGLGWLPDGSTLVVSMRDRRVLRWDGGDRLQVHADVAEHCGGHLNDMVVDAQGRAWVGNFGFDLMAGADPAPAKLVRVDPDGSAAVAASDLLFPNGSVITPDGATLIVGETTGARYTAFTIGPNGELTDRRLWAQLASTPPPGSFDETLAQLRVAPDGCALDVDGCLWVADALGARVLRVAEGGDILEQRTVPEGLGAFACMLGGDGGRTLLVCAAPDFLEHNREGAGEAVLLTTEVDAPHAGLP